MKERMSDNIKVALIGVTGVVIAALIALIGNYINAPKIDDKKASPMLIEKKSDNFSVPRDTTKKIEEGKTQGSSIRKKGSVKETKEKLLNSAVQKFEINMDNNYGPINQGTITLKDINTNVHKTDSIKNK